MPEVTRIRHYFGYSILAVLWLIIGFVGIAPTIETAPCPDGFYNQDTSMLCATCSYQLSDACLTCTDQFNCTTCVTDHYLDIGRCFECARSFQGCQECNKNGCN